MENNNIQAVEWTEKCPVCGSQVKFKITKRDRSYAPYIIQGCKHFADGDFIDQSKYRCIVNMLKELYENPDLLYARINKKQELEKLKMLGIDINKYL